MPGTQLSVDMPGDPIELNAAGDPTHIRLKPFYEAVKSAWATFDTSRINPSFRRERAPKVPITTTVAMFPGFGYWCHDCASYECYDSHDEENIEGIIRLNRS